jgi:hypothetical protein
VSPFNQQSSFASAGVTGRHPDETNNLMRLFTKQPHTAISYKYPAAWKMLLTRPDAGNIV